MTATETLEECSEPSVFQALTSYSFEDLDDRGREQVTLHVWECPVCSRELDRLESCVRALRHDPNLRPLSLTPEVLSVLGMSGRLEQPFGGHSGFVLSVSGLFGVLHAASVWTELGYSYDRFAGLAWTLSPIVCLWVAGMTALALHFDVAATLRQKASGLGWASLTSAVALSLLTALCWLVLPNAPTIDATFQTRSASVGFLKNELLYFLPLLLFLLPTFHAVVRFQAELRAGRVKIVADLLTGRPEAVAPPGVWLVPVWLLVAVLLLAAFIGYGGIHHMLDNLKAGRHAGLFSAALHLRVALWYVVAFVCLAWYQRTLNELKREALLASRLLDCHG